MSYKLAYKPSRRAAMPTMALSVTTPVPPTPAIRISVDPVGTNVASGKGGRAVESSLTVRRGRASVTVTKEGQNPLTQEKSLLQLDWSITRLRPSSVSSGWTARQLDSIEQSPQPSQTAALMKRRRLGSGKAPIL